MMHIKSTSSCSRFLGCLAERQRRWIAAACVLLTSTACSSAPSEVGTEGLVSWARPSPAGPPFALFPRLAASDTGLFIGYRNTVIAVRARDGQFLWQRSTEQSILALDQDAFSAAFRKSPMKRAKLAGLRRNAAVVMTISTQAID